MLVGKFIWLSTALQHITAAGQRQLLARRHPFRNFKPLKVVDALLNQQEHLIGWHNCSHRKEREERKENLRVNLCALRVLCGYNCSIKTMGCLTPRNHI